MAINKVVFGTNTLIDLTADTVTAAQVLSGVTAHDRSGEAITGTCSYDADTTDATASAAEVISGRTAYVSGVKLTGTMPNNGAAAGVISTKSGQYSIPMGFHDGSGRVTIDGTEQAKLIASNIKSGVEILGVTGSYGGESVSAQAKSVTPGVSAQTVLPDSGYDYLSQVTVGAIPYTETNNASGGKTVTIAGV